jgi:putative polyketide hydroxylase
VPHENVERFQVAGIDTHAVGEGADGATAPLLDYATVALGYRYRSAAVLDAAADPRPALPPAELRGQPGTRAPHVWLTRAGERLSTIDLFGRGFVLLTGAAGAAWVDAAKSLPGIAIDAYRIGDGDLTDPDGRWPDAYGGTNAGAVLVRPDGFVAWRAARAVDDPARALMTTISDILGQPSAAPAVRASAGRPA